MFPFGKKYYDQLFERVWIMKWRLYMKNNNVYKLILLIALSFVGSVTELEASKRQTDSLDDNRVLKKRRIEAISTEVELSFDAYDAEFQEFQLGRDKFNSAMKIKEAIDSYIESFQCSEKEIDIEFCDSRIFLFIKELEKAADLGNADAYYQLGEVYAGDFYRDEDADLAIELYKKARALGHDDASYGIFLTYLMNKEDFRKAAKWYTRAKEDGCDVDLIGSDLYSFFDMYTDHE